MFHLNWDIYKPDNSDICILQQLKEKKYINGTKGNEVRNAGNFSANDS